MELALFPLPSHVLPGGKLPLRIFEQRYLRMVKQSASGKRALAMAMVNPNYPMGTLARVQPLVTQCRICDFEQLADGTLGITVQGEQLLLIERVWQEPDGLFVADTQQSSLPTLQLSAEQQQHYQQLVQLLIQNNPSLSRCIDEQANHDSCWPVWRLVEWLPFDSNLKQQLLRTGNIAALDAAISRLISAAN